MGTNKTNEIDRAKGQQILDTLIAVLREGQARELVAPTLTTVRAHVLIVTNETAKRLVGVATREEVLETWLMMHMTLAMQNNGEVSEPVHQAVGDA